MSYFNYHAKVKKLIDEKHCTGARLMESYHNISPALVLYFDNHPPMPIREHKFAEYFELLEKHQIKTT